MAFEKTQFKFEISSCIIQAKLEVDSATNTKRMSKQIQELSDHNSEVHVKNLRFYLHK